MPKTISKSEAIKLQKQVSDKKGSIASFNRLGLIKPSKARVMYGQTKKDALKGLKINGVFLADKNDDKAFKSNNWIRTEYDFQVAVAKLLDAKGLDWFHCPNEAKRSPQLGAKLKKAGMKAGIPDCVIINPTILGHKGLCIELKVGKNNLTTSQNQWFIKFMSNGWEYSTAYGLQEVQDVIEIYYGK